MNIVLMHGAIGRAVAMPLAQAYFNGVARRLESAFRCRVLETEVPLCGSIERRAVWSANQIRQALEGGRLDGSAPVHIVAHSVGGFDARYLVSNDVCGLRARVRTVTCIGTPHLGCPVVTKAVRLFRDWPVARLPFPFSVPFAATAFWLDALMALEQTEAVRFGERCADAAHVRYFNVVGSGRRAPLRTAVVLMPAAALLAVCGQPDNDGLVSMQSAAGGRTPFAVWEEDHAGLVGHDLDNPFGRPRLVHLDRYERLIAAVTRS